MFIILQVVSVAAVFALTYLFFTMIGQRRVGLLFRRTEVDQWQRGLGERLGHVLTVANIFATVTSLATVYAFFIGSSKLFGGWTFLCCITIVLGGIVSNFFSSRIRNRPRTRAILDSEDQSGAVVASLFWSEKTNNQSLSSAVKTISLINISAIIWLEFSIFGDITGRIVGANLLTSTFIVWSIAFGVFWFTLGFGLRGFVAADLLHSSLIVISVLMIAGGTLALLASAPWSTSAIKSALKPLSEVPATIIFFVHLMIVNGFIVLTSEAHWLRMWVFSTKELTMQVRAQMLTASIWAILILVGLVASQLTGAIDTANVSGLLGHLSDVSPIFLIAFWVGATAALFSTADSQIYCFRLVRSFSCKTGRISEVGAAKPSFVVALGGSILTAGVYYCVRRIGVPFDKIVFVLLPLTLNFVPALVLLAFGREIPRGLVYFSAAGYLGIAILGFIADQTDMTYSLAAATVPIAATCLGLLISRKETT